MNLGLDPELSHIVSNFYAGGITCAEFDHVYSANRETLIAGLRAAAEATSSSRWKTCRRRGLGFANLTPGDFAQARRQADMLGIAEDACRVVALLAEISRMKPGASLSAIGFARPRGAEPP